MIKAPIPEDEEQRLNTLEEYQILDTLAEQTLDEITKTAALICECNISLISLIDKNRQWFKSSYGLDAKETPRDVSYCGHAIMNDELFLVEDAKTDERFCGNPLLLGEPYVRFYAGMPLVAPNGSRIGTLCVIDSETKTLSETQRQLLKTLALQVVNYFELRKINRDKDQRLYELSSYKKTIDEHALFVRTDINGIITFANEKFFETTQYSKYEIIGKSHNILNSGFHNKTFFESLWKTIKEANVWRGEIKNKKKDGTFYWVNTTIVPHINNDNEIVEFFALYYDISEKKQAKAEVIEKRRKLEVIFSQSKDAVMTLAPPTWKFTSANPATLELFKVKSENDFKLLGPWDLSPEFQPCGQSSALVAQKYIKGAMEEGVQFFEWRHKTIDNTEIPCTVLLSKIEEGDNVYLNAVVRDISEEKKLKNELTLKNDDLNKSISFLRNIQDNAAHAIITTTVDGTITSFNKAAEKMLGYEANELVNKETPAIFHDLDEVVERAALFSKKLDKNIAPGFETFVCHTDINVKNAFEWTYVHKTGNRFPVQLSITAIRDDNGVAIGYLGLAENLTEQKVLEKELLKKNIEFEEAQALAKIGSWKFDTSTGKIKWSKEMYNIFPENIEDGEPDFEKHKATIFHEDVEHWVKTVSTCLENGKPYELKFRTYKKENKDELLWVEAKGQGIFKNSEIVSLSGTCQDITENVEKEEELKKHVKALKIAEKAKSEFLANMSHEIRTPMNGIIGMLDLIQDTNLTESQIEMLDTIAISSKTLLSLLSDILDISKIESGKLGIEKRSFNLNDCIQSVCNLLDSNASEKGTLIENVSNEMNSSWFLGDETRIRQIIMNFASNSVKFTDRGIVKIGYELVDTNHKKKKIRIFVKDNGIGIAKENQRKILKAFEQADSSITRKYGGTGLGLAICSKLASIMGGKINLESEEGVGSTFFLELELKESDEMKKMVSNDVEIPLLAIQYPHNILVAEDNKVNQKVVKMTLKKFGYDCVIVENGIEVLLELKSKKLNHYSVILMDMQMPEMDGVTATEEAVRVYGTDCPQIIALTANAFIADQEECLKAGMVDYLSKPLNKDKLAEVLAKYCKNPNLKKIA